MSARSLARGAGVLLALMSSWCPSGARADAPNYEQLRLDAIYPAGAQQGQSVTLELLGGGNANFSGVKGIVVDGPPGVTARDFKEVLPYKLQATFDVAADAPPGRRCVRVLSERSGLSNMIYFNVGRLPEALEVEPNNEPGAAQTVASLPVVMNGRVDPKADADCFRFELKKGQRLVAAVLAHAIDSHGQYANYGFVDATLQLLDGSGAVVAEALDTLGLDPQIEFVAPADGAYTARVHLEAFEGFPQAVYRLVLGEVVLPTAMFPPGGRRGETTEVELSGPNVPPGARQRVAVPADDPFPLQHVTPGAEHAGAGSGLVVADLELPFVRGDWPERLEAEPNADAGRATPLDVPMTANGRIDSSGDEDFYRLRLAMGQAVLLEIAAQRFLRSPVDTLLEVYDASGTKLAENDDGFPIDYVSMHDFRPMDSRLVFTAPADGDYAVRMSDQSGGAGGPRAVYRLTVTPAQPSFEIYHYPDGMPVWGPGSTACLIAKVVRLDGMTGDVTLTVEGLPPGWSASTAVSRGPGSTPPQDPLLHQFVTITAPADAKPGEAFPFRLVGRAELPTGNFTRVGQPLSLYYTSDVGLFRNTPVARVAVAAAQSPWLSTTTESVAAAPGGTIEIPVQVHGADKLDAIDLGAEMAGNGVATALAVPQTVPVQQGAALLRAKLDAALKPGRYGITVALRWRSDIRIGAPGPCTRLITLDVTAPPPPPPSE